MYSYDLETHLVTTDDGYILKVYRIPGKKDEEKTCKKKKAVFFQHGLLVS